ncbi:hypothetical protein ACNKHW_03380 [Shigella flexneri]
MSLQPFCRHRQFKQRPFADDKPWLTAAPGGHSGHLPDLRLESG